MTARFPQPVYGGTLHRIANKPIGEAPGRKTRNGERWHVRADHPAIVEGRTLFPSTVVHPKDSPRLLVSGMNQRKIGRMITKGRWTGCPLYTLTLEERATCPRSCGEWRTCYGSNMHLARRHMAGLALEGRLIEEVVDLAAKHPGGFAVRLHILGDFYSAAYVDLWRMLLDEVPQLRVFGFTARAMSDEIGRGVALINDRHPDHCRIRFSGTDGGPTGSLVIASAAESRHVLCPVQAGATDCCGTCGLCWTMDRTVEFVRH